MHIYKNENKIIINLKKWKSGKKRQLPAKNMTRI